MNMEVKSIQKDIREKWLALLGAFPERRPEFAPEIGPIERLEYYDRRKITLPADADYPEDRIRAWLLIPHRLKAKTPAILCLHPTTFGCGKDIVVNNLDGYAATMPENIKAQPPEFFSGRAYGHELALRGYVVLAPDIYADGERLEPGRRPYEPIEFYRRYPEWSVVGKAIWDNMLVLDFLCSLDYVDQANLGIIGHSLGGHSSIFTAGFDERIKATVSNGGCTVFRKYFEHWSRLPLPPELVATRPPVYCYLPRFRPYLGNHAIANPVKFGELMGLICPRHLLYAGATSNSGHEGGLEVMQETWDDVFAIYRQAGVEANVHYHIYPGNHGFPDRARDFVYRWLDEKLRHNQ